MGNERVSGEKPRQLVAVEIDDFEPAFPLPNQDESETLRRHSIVFRPEGDDGLQGGTGRVLHVWNACGDAMALKQPLLDLVGSEREARGRRDAFYEEYATQLTLSHLRGFPDLYGHGTVEGEPAILMEWVVGQTLESARDTLETEPSPDGPRVPARTVAALGVAVLDVLAAADSLDRGLVHRDLSPKNIMLRTSRLDVREQARREDFDVCLIDFGSSALLGRAAGGTFTQRTNVWRNGTPEYAPPEMLTSDLAGAEELRRDPSIDVYSLCSVLYELYSGHTPYRLNEREVSSNYLAKHDRPPAPPRVRRSEDVPLVSAILSGIKPVQADRIDAARLRSRRLRCLHAPGLPQGPGPRGPERPERQGRRPRALPSRQRPGRRRCRRRRIRREPRRPAPARPRRRDGPLGPRGRDGRLGALPRARGGPGPAPRGARARPRPKDGLLGVRRARRCLGDPLVLLGRGRLLGRPGPRTRRRHGALGLHR